MKISLGHLIWIVVIVAIIAPISCVYSQGLQLIGSCPLPGCDWYSAIWVDGDYAYVTRNDNYSFVIINISNPSEPIVVGSMNLLFTAQDVCAHGDYAYLTYLCQGIGGLVIMDVSDRNNPQQISYVRSGPDGHRLCKQKNMVYLANCIIGISLFDVSNPFVPYRVAMADSDPVNDSEGIFVQGSYAYASYWWVGLHIFNIQNPQSPQQVSVLNTNTFQPDDVVVYGNYAFVESHNYMLFNGIKVVDISDPQNPFVAASYSISDYRPCSNIFLDYPYLLIAHRALSVLEISDPIHPRLAGAIDSSVYGKTALDVFSRNGIIYTTSDSSLRIFQFTPTGISDEGPISPMAIGLLQNYPNPFNAQTTISYSLPKASLVEVDIYDLSGRKLETLVDEKQEAGNHSIIWDAQNRSSGTYLCRIKAGEASLSTKMVLVK